MRRLLSSTPVPGIALQPLYFTLLYLQYTEYLLISGCSGSESQIFFAVNEDLGNCSELRYAKKELYGCDSPCLGRRKMHQDPRSRYRSSVGVLDDVEDKKLLYSGGLILGLSKKLFYSGALATGINK